MTQHRPQNSTAMLRIACAILCVGNLAGTFDCEGCEVVRPRALAAGDTIMFIAPAGPLNREKMELARSRLVEMGFHVRVPDNLYRKTGYLAGSDAQRAAELMDAFSDPEVDAIFPGTGGYGTMRILPLLDFDVIQRNPKILVGFSDITALHLAIHQKTGLVTFHSPNPMWGLGNEQNLTAYSAKWFWRALLRPQDGTTGKASSVGYLISARWPETSPVGGNSTGKATSIAATGAGTSELDHHLPPPVVVLRPGRASGRLTGGNLSLVAATIGTDFEIETDGKILFLEDVGEAPYRVDRMLCTLKLAGKLDHLAGVVLGMFTRRDKEDTSDEITTIEDVLADYFLPLKIPVVRSFPIGHARNNATFPIGVQCELDAEAGTLRLLEDPVLVNSR